LSAPAGTSKEIVAKLQEASLKALASPEIRERLQAQGFVVAGNSPDQFAAFVRDEITKWGKAAKASGAVLD